MEGYKSVSGEGEKFFMRGCKKKNKLKSTYWRSSDDKSYNIAANFVFLCV